MTAYDRLTARFARIATIGEAGADAGLGRRGDDAAGRRRRRAAISSRCWPGWRTGC